MCTQFIDCIYRLDTLSSERDTRQKPLDDSRLLRHSYDDDEPTNAPFESIEVDFVRLEGLAANPS